MATVSQLLAENAELHDIRSESLRLDADRIKTRLLDKTTGLQGDKREAMIDAVGGNVSLRDQAKALDTLVFGSTPPDPDNPGWMAEWRADYRAWLRAAKKAESAGFPLDPNLRAELIERSNLNTLMTNLATALRDIQDHETARDILNAQAKAMAASGLPGM